MLSNIAFKATACVQLSMHESLQKFAKKHPYIAIPVTAFVCIADVSLETINPSSPSCSMKTGSKFNVFDTTG